jgi:N6-L-threonylcarbamoyladenine synthase
MPTTPRKARVLLKEGKAKVKKRTPFTIQLLQPSGETKQPIRLGVDSGFVHVGLSAVSKKQELYSADVQLRTDVVDLLSEKRAYRRTRRGRKTRYRQPRFSTRSRWNPLALAGGGKRRLVVDVPLDPCYNPWLW